MLDRSRRRQRGGRAVMAVIGSVAAVAVSVPVLLSGRPTAGSLSAQSSSTTTTVWDTSTAGTATPTLPPGSCRGTGSKTAATTAHLGSSAAVTLTFQARCEGVPFLLHVALVMEASSGMGGQPERKVNQAMLDFVDGLGLAEPHHPKTRVAVVGFNDRARTLTQLTDDVVRVRRALGDIRSEGGINIGSGMNEGTRALVRGRSLTTDPDWITDAMIVVSTGMDDRGCPSALQAASDAKRRGILVVAVCALDDCEKACMGQIASSPRYLYALDEIGGLIAVFRQIRDRIINVNLKRAVIEDVLPANMLLQQGSASPEPAHVAPDGRMLRWDEAYVPKDGITVSYRVEPLDLGRHPANVSAVVTWTSGFGLVGSLRYPVPFIDVSLRPTDTPTATPTDTADPTATPTSRPTFTATSTPAPHLYLPGLRSSRASESR